MKLCLEIWFLASFRNFEINIYQYTKKNLFIRFMSVAVKTKFITYKKKSRIGLFFCKIKFLILGRKH